MIGLSKIKLGMTIFSCALFPLKSAFAAYDAYPNNGGPYLIGPVSTSLSWKGEKFDNFQNGQLIECSNSQSLQAGYDVTSGCLSAKYVDELKHGWIDYKTFRVVTDARNTLNQKMKWTNQTVEYRAYIEEWHKNGNIPAWSGLHAFVRYQTSDDLYVASIRYDGYVTIKVKYQGKYTTLAQIHLSDYTNDYFNADGKLAEKQWYDIKFTAYDTQLTLYLNNQIILATTNQLIDAGTTGIRVDYASTYLDDWHVSAGIKNDDLDEPTNPPQPTTPIWNQDTIYHGGDIISYNNIIYKAKWWTLGDLPDQGDPWQVYVSKK